MNAARSPCMTHSEHLSLSQTSSEPGRRRQGGPTHLTGNGGLQVRTVIMYPLTSHGTRVLSFRSRWRRYLPLFALLMYLAMIVLGSIRGMAQQVFHDTNDKVLHALAYGTLAALLFLGQSKPVFRRSVIVVLVIALLGALDELIQRNFPYRSPDPMDWLADVSAAIAVCAILAAVRAVWYARQRKLPRS